MRDHPAISLFRRGIHFITEVFLAALRNGNQVATDVDGVIIFSIKLIFASYMDIRSVLPLDHFVWGREIMLVLSMLRDRDDPILVVLVVLVSATKLSAYWTTLQSIFCIDAFVQAAASSVIIAIIIRLLNDGACK